MGHKFWDRLAPKRRPRPPVTLPPPEVKFAGFYLPCSDASVRPSIPDGFQVPTEPGPFTFPQPYIAQGILVARGVRPRTYSYWRQINNHVNDSFLWVYASILGRGIVIFAVDKASGRVWETEYQLPLGDHTGEGVYWSSSERSVLYYSMGPRIFRLDVVYNNVPQLILDISEYGLALGEVNLWQCHSSWDHKVHSGTVIANGQPIGFFTYATETSQLKFEPFDRIDECQIDKSGQYLLCKQKDPDDNTVIDRLTGSRWIRKNVEGAIGHSDNGWGYVIGEDDYFRLPGAVILQPLNEAQKDQRQLLYHTTDWSSGMGHISHCGPSEVAWLSNCSPHLTPRANEILWFSTKPQPDPVCCVIAPNLVTGVTSENRYDRSPKGNCDVTGDWFAWTADAGREDYSLFLVHR